MFCSCRPLAHQEFFTKPKFSHVIEPNDCLSAPCSVVCLDMYSLQVEDLEVPMFVSWKLRLSSQTRPLIQVCFIFQEVKGQFHFCVERCGVFHGFTAWFTVYFESLETGGATLELDTGPHSE